MTDGSVASDPVYDLVVVGGGVVGLACLRAATLRGWKCALVEGEVDLLSHASGGNSGIVCTGVDTRPGTLERALIRDSVSEFRTYCQSHNVPMRPCGSLVCLFPWDVTSNEKDGADNIANDNDCTNGETGTHHLFPLEKVLKESHIAGDSGAALFGNGQKVLLEKEKNVSPSLMGAVHIPGEIVVDSWVYSISLAAHALENGAQIYTNFRVTSIKREEIGDQDDGNDRTWKVSRECGNEPSDVPTVIRGKAILNATGNWSDATEKVAFGSSEWVAKPRRGQYRVYNSNDQTQIIHPLQPIPSQRTKGIFVFSTLYDQLVVGPTALDQSSKTDRSIDPKVARELDDHIRRVIPNIDTEKSYVGDYVGIRPGTNHRDYQIHLKPEKRWIAVAGIRSTGLTASLGIGNYVVRLLQSILRDPSDALREDGDSQVHDQASSERVIKTTPMPTVEKLAEDFVTNGDGCCTIHGLRYRVTHPLTKLGFKSLMSNKLPSKSCR
ncbi:unnamed protein product [Pseudo-nitzschia multistriata]|uniref:FAD dependent oxidoreductase domain-containing protein n=1 Tax=Pseudo-nitzschia multistriata TaxID=183589 RepID=A0A448Z8F4_9STRA|nr:unnamed protein product [Pseudo-nitzschia multistriata]